jgi:hypothetical protein
MYFNETTRGIGSVNVSSRLNAVPKEDQSRREKHLDLCKKR